MKRSRTKTQSGAVQLPPDATRERCPSCGSSGFPASVIPGRCHFCDGTEGGHPPEPTAPLKEPSK